MGASLLFSLYCLFPLSLGCLSLSSPIFLVHKHLISCVAFNSSLLSLSSFFRLQAVTKTFSPLFICLSYLFILLWLCFISFYLSKCFVITLFLLYWGCKQTKTNKLVFVCLLVLSVLELFFWNILHQHFS